MQTPETNKDPNAIELVEATNLQVGQTYFFPEGGHEYSYAKNAPTVDNHFDDSQKFESKQGDTFRIINEIKYTYDKNLLEIEHTNPLDNSAPQRMWVEDQTIASHGLAVDKRKGDNTPISPSRKTQLTDSLSDTDLRIDDTTKGTRLLTLRAVKQGLQFRQS